MHPFMAGELGEQFDLKRALRVGLLPVLWGTDTPEQHLAAYVGTYLEEEVRQEALVRKLDAFARFLEVAAFSHGTAPNYSAIGRECGISGNTAESYMAILHDLLLAFSVPCYGRRPKKKTIGAPKFYFSDVGIYGSLRAPRFGTIGDSRIGFSWEGLVAQHLRAWCDYSSGRHGLYYWRGTGGAEVDFVVCGEDGLWAFEVKGSRMAQPEHLSGLRAFHRENPEASLFLIYGGKQSTVMGNVHCLPGEDFLRNLGTECGYPLGRPRGQSRHLH
jgi:predicted AAA+ superfamily ATPase